MTESKKNSNRENILHKTQQLYIVIAILGVLIIFRITYIFLGRADYLEKRKSEILSDVSETQPHRGNIFDAEYNLLAASIPYYDISFDPCAPSEKNFKANIDSLALMLHNYFGQKPAKWYKDTFEYMRNHKRRYIKIKTNADYQQKTEIKKFPLFRLGRNKGGLIITPEERRVHTTGKIMKRTLGSLRDDNVTGMQNAETGLEQYYNKELSGIAGRYTGKFVPRKGFIANEGGMIYQEIPANDIVTAIDINLQYFADDALRKQLHKVKAKTGVAVVMEVKTGYIKAIVNLGLNPKDTVPTYSERLNYAVGSFGRKTPGSTFKIPVIIAAMEDKLIKFDDTINTGKKRYHVYFKHDTIRDDYAYGQLTVQQVIEKSSNLGMAKIVYDNYFKTGQTGKLIQRLKEMGFGTITGIDLGGEAAPYIKTPGDGDWNNITPMRMASGYEVETTPIQMLTFYNALANGGVMCKPQIVKELRCEGKVVRTFEPQIINRAVCEKSTLKHIQEALIGVVEHGTAKRIKTSKYKIAGKTGTATIYDKETGYTVKKYQASFVGYFPADNPKYSCIVVVTEPDPKTGLYYGATAAAPVFRKIADELYRKDFALNKEIVNDEPEGKKSAPLAKNGNREDIAVVLRALGININAKNLATDWVTTSEDSTSVNMRALTINENLVPDVRQMTAKDAVYLLESLGLNVKISGRGSVKKQSLPPGTKIRKGMNIILTL